MCGRYTYKLTWSEIVALYQLTLPLEEPERLGPNYNVAPTQVMPIILPAGNGRELVLAKWGLIPFWSKPEQVAKPAYSTINARDDRIQTAPTYRDSFRKRRCLVPATGWYEWQKLDAKTKQPYHFRPSAAPFAFGGICDTWKGNGGLPDVSSFSIVTTAAAPSTAAYHDRMPLILEAGQFDDWVRGPAEQAATMMKPYAGDVELWPVAGAVGNVRNNRPELMERTIPGTADRHTARGDSLGNA